MKEANAKEADLKKCENLINQCKNIDVKVAKAKAQQALVENSKDKSKKKKNKKQKKAEMLSSVLELDTLRPQFELYGVPVPKGKEELQFTIGLLQQKVNDIKNRPLNYALLCQENGEDSFDASSDTLSVSTLSLSN